MDLAFERMPDQFKPQFQLYASRQHRWAARSAAGVITPSEATAADVRELWGVHGVTVAPLGPGQAPVPNRGQARHFLYVGDGEPRKNLPRLLAAYAQYRAGTDEPLDLVIAGRGAPALAEPTATEREGAAAGRVYDGVREGAASGRVCDGADGVREGAASGRVCDGADGVREGAASGRVCDGADGVREGAASGRAYTGADGVRPDAAAGPAGDGVRVDREPDLPDLHRHAAALVLVSLHEGFGLPVLEAMHAGTPVIASDIPALREVCAGAARYVDPYDPASIAAALTDVGNVPPLREELRRRGTARAATFSWERCARAHLRAYAAALASPGA